MNYLLPRLLCGFIIFSSVAYAFEFRRIAETHEEAGTYVVCILEDSRAHYAFRPPVNWDVRYDEQARTVTMAPKKDGKSWITLRLAPSTNSPNAGVRNYVRAAYPNGEFAEQFTLNTSSQEAQVADFTDASAGPLPLKRRLALVGSQSGTFEILLSSRADDFSNGEQIFSQLLGSFEHRGPPQPRDKVPSR